jgi:glutamate N-acetyltransferase/amino-acid N-acetyltransferase
VGDSLNRITVDGDTSTNDCAVILASGAQSGAVVAEGGTFNAFRRGLSEAARRLAEMLVRDGEGVTKIADVRVEGARTTADADRIARVVAESALVKTALHGGDPNWGRILARWAVRGGSTSGRGIHREVWWRTAPRTSEKDAAGRQEDPANPHPPGG